MKDIIIEIVKRDIPRGLIFDSHAVIFLLLQKSSDDYLTQNKNQTTASYHGSIAAAIASLENDGLINKVGSSWSKNIHDKFSKCECWKKL